MSNQHHSINHEEAFWPQASPLLFITAIFVLNFSARIVLAPLLPAIEEDLHITHAQSGMFFLLLAAGYFVAMINSGYLSARITHRGTIILSCAALGCSLIAVSLAPTLTGIRLGFFGVGCAAGLYLPSAIATITALIASRHWGKGIAIHELAPNLAFVAVPFLAELLLASMSWRTILLYFGTISVVLSATFAVFGRGGRFAGTPPVLHVVRMLLAMRSFWIIALLFAMAVAATLGVFAMLPVYLVSAKGMTEAWANTLVGLSRIICPPMALVAGWSADRFGVRRTMAVTLALSGATTILIGAGHDNWLLLGIFLQPAVSVGFFPAGFSALAGIGNPTMRSVAVAMAVPLAFVLGGGLIPWLLGIAGDFERFGWGFVGVGLFILLGTDLALRIEPPKP